MNSFLDFFKVDRGLRAANGKLTYEYMFAVKLPRRVYYLAASTLDEMNSWVSAICDVCGLRGDREDSIADSEIYTASQKPLSKASLDHEEDFGDNELISNPYIHISTCYSGSKQPNNNVIQNKNRMISTTSSQHSEAQPQNFVGL